MSSSIHSFHICLDRRRLLKSLLAATGGIITSDIYAEALVLTPQVTEGPYYPDHLPLDQDNNLLQVNGDDIVAEGTVTEFGGRLLNADGKPVANHVVELWQADNNGCYIHSKGTQRSKERDAHFQGYGKMVTNEKGEYRFRTIRPGLYTGRTIHWHIAVNQGDKRMLTTQLCLAGVEQNDRDGVLRGIRDEAQRLSIIREFKPKSPDSKEIVGTWDIVLGATPDERQMGRPPGPGRPQRGEDAERRPRPPRGESAQVTDRELRRVLFGPLSDL